MIVYTLIKKETFTTNRTKKLQSSTTDPDIQPNKKYSGKESKKQT